MKKGHRVVIQPYNNVCGTNYSYQHGTITELADWDMGGPTVYVLLDNNHAVPFSEEVISPEKKWDTIEFVQLSYPVRTVPYKDKALVVGRINDLGSDLLNASKADRPEANRIGDIVGYLINEVAFGRFTDEQIIEEYERDFQINKQTNSDHEKTK